jgi:ParB family transcriptional regulator, chromosome partitioning protein
MKSRKVQITRDQLLAMGRELLGDQWSQARSRDTKGELADALERAFADPHTVACTPTQREKLKHWLPDGMAFDTGSALLAADTEDRQAA